MKKSIVFGYHGMLNLGDDEFLNVVVDKLSFQHDIYVYGDNEIFKNKYKNLNVRGLWSGKPRFRVYQKWLMLTIKALSADVFVFSAGSILTVLPFKYVYILLKIIKTFNKKIKLFGIGLSVGPFSNKSDEYYCNKIIDLFDKVYVRDDTIKRIKNNKSNVIQALDLCFGSFREIERKYAGIIKEKRLLIALNEHNYNSFESNERVKKIVEFVILALKEKLITGVDLFITCSDDGYGDSNITLQLKSELNKNNINVDVLSHEGNVDDSIAYLSSYKYVLSSRLHTGFFSFLSGSKVIQLAYAEKIKQFYKHTDIEGMTIIDPYAFSPEYLLNILSSFQDKLNSIEVNKDKEIVIRKAINELSEL
jgi:polysaccharide pyruvyl transferase WcaK-like protein